MELIMMLIGLVTGATAASLVVLAWAASQRRWLAAHCDRQITHWHQEAERARIIAAWLSEQQVAGRGDWPGHHARRQRKFRQ